MTPAHILVVDDERDFCELLRWELSSLGHEVVSADNAAQALSELAKAEFDLVITDVQMPGTNGAALLEKIKEQTPDTEVIVLTANADMDTAIACMRAGAIDFLRKPVNLFEVNSAIARAIERRGLRAEAALFRATQAIFHAPGLGHLFPVIADVAKKAMHADDISLLLPGLDGKFRLAYSHGVPRGEQASVAIALGEGVAGRVALEKRPALIPARATDNPRFAGLANSVRVRSSIVFPLVEGERVVGILDLNRIAIDRPFLPSDLERAEVLASQVLLALRFYREELPT